MRRPRSRPLAIALVALCVSVCFAGYSAASTLLAASRGPDPIGHVAASDNSLAAVACPAANDCVVAGAYGTGVVERALIDVESDGTWSVQKVPLPVGARVTRPADDVAAITCVSAGSCVGAGSYTTASGSRAPLIEVDTAGTWSAVAAPLPKDASTLGGGQLAAVSCADTTDCVAVGSYLDKSGHRGALVDAETAGSWAAVAVPLPAGASTTAPDNSLNAVACTSTTTCVAAGRYADAGGGNEALIATGNAGTWSAAAARLPSGASTAGADNNLEAVVCSTVGACVAAGEYVAGTGGRRALLDVETAGVWAAVVAPLPSDASPSGASSGLRALSCPSPGACVAVGTYELASGNEAPLVETDAGGAWSARSGPLPSDAATRGFIDSLDAVSCTVAMDCAAVGLYVDGAGSQHPHALLDVAIDGAWLPGTVEVPADANTTSPYSTLDAVSCTALASCVAAGLYLDVHGDSQALLDAMSVALVSIPLAPSAPNRPHAVPEHGQAKISWSVAASLGGSPVTRYVATASPGGATCSSTATRCTVWGLTPHDRYTFRVVAASSLGSSPPSAPSTPITVAARIPASFVVRPFAEGSSALTPASRAQLARIASIVFADGDTHIVLVGYSDDRGAPGKRVELSARRAAVVERFLRRALGALGSSRMEFIASARGSADPVASNRTAIGRSANRRVTIVAT